MSDPEMPTDPAVREMVMKIGAMNVLQNEDFTALASMHQDVLALEHPALGESESLDPAAVIAALRSVQEVADEIIAMMSEQESLIQ